MTPVIRVPKITALSVEEVSFCSTPCILPPASFSRPAPIMDMPYRNSAIPPNREVMCVISITILLKNDLPFDPCPSALPAHRACFIWQMPRSAALLHRTAHNDRAWIYYIIFYPVTTRFILQENHFFYTFFRLLIVSLFLFSIILH